MKEVHTKLLIIFVFISLVHCSGCIESENKYKFIGPPSQEVIDSYLSRAITMSDFFHEFHGEMPLTEGLRLIQNIGAKFIGRVAFVYGNEAMLPQILISTETKASFVHQLDSDIIIQAAIFEIITPELNTLQIPSYVFDDFDIPNESRSFNYSRMLFEKTGPFAHNIDVFGQNCSVPDITQQETQFWYYYLATSYIDCGIEAIHLGIFEWVTEADKNYQHTCQLIEKIRAYATDHARREWVFLDAHTHGIKKDDNLLLDFHSFPLLPKENESFYDASLEKGFLQSIYGKSKGGYSPAGWYCEHQSYLVEFDHGYSNGSIEQNTGENFIWGMDEITWFSVLSEQKRNDFLKYTYDWLENHDPIGHVQMPGMRPIWVNFANHPEEFYYANTKSNEFPLGYNQEETIKELWSEN